MYCRHVKGSSSSRQVTFKRVVIQGGGRLVIESNDPSGFTLIGQSLLIESGGRLEADRLTLKVDNLTLHQAALLQADYKVTFL